MKHDYVTYFVFNTIDPIYIMKGTVSKHKVVHFVGLDLYKYVLSQLTLALDAIKTVVGSKFGLVV